MEDIKKDARLIFKVTPETRTMLIKLKRAHERSMTGVIEQLIKKDFADRGLGNKRSAS
jgi:hypothetical protein